MNRATTDLLYGIQNAPSTACDPSPYDKVATFWDAEHPIGSREAERVQRLLASLRGQYPPHVLDIGCGTGRVLNLGPASPDRYAALESSQAMLNLLVRKHPKAAAVYPGDVRDALASGQFTPGQFDWVFVDAAVDLDAQQLAQAGRIARLAAITIDGDQWGVQDVREASVRDVAPFAVQMQVSP